MELARKATCEAIHYIMYFALQTQRDDARSGRSFYHVCPSFDFLATYCACSRGSSTSILCTIGIGQIPLSILKPASILREVLGIEADDATTRKKRAVACSPPLCCSNDKGGRGRWWGLKGQSPAGIRPPGGRGCPQCRS